jgi:3-phenylpropionate/trans-cinnamate dioxygenase ferredoxin reductase subunit
MPHTVVIIGAGLAGARTAETLRSEGFGGPVILLGQEEHLPYDRPPLSKDVLQGKKEPDSALLHDAAWYAAQHIDVRTGHAVTALDPSGTVTLDDGSTVAFDTAVLATGSRPRRLDLPGADLDGVFSLRTMDDSVALREALSHKRNVVLVGAGWIGLEVAAAARAAENTVTVIEPQEAPLQAALGRQLGDVFRRLHEEHGVTFRFGDGVTELVGDGGRVTGVTTKDGATLPADVVVVGVGAQPNTELASAAGLSVDGGVVVDASMQTSDPRVYAVGDVARWDSPALGYPIRVEHWANALNSGPIAGRAIAGSAPGNDLLPYFYTDQYDMGMEYVGDVPRDSGADVVVRGDLASREFIAFWVSPDDRVLAALAMNIWDVIDPIKELIRSRAAVDRDRLTDLSVPVTELADPSNG